MAKRRSMKSFQKVGSLKKLSATFLSLAFLFVISIVLHFVFNKYTIENLANNNGAKNYTLEVSIIFYKDPSNGNVDENITDQNNFSGMKNYFKNNKKIYFIKDNSSRINAYKLPSSSILTAGDYPIAVLSTLSNFNNKKTYKTHFTRLRSKTYLENDIIPHIAS